MKIFPYLFVISLILFILQIFVFQSPNGLIGMLICITLVITIIVSAIISFKTNRIIKTIIIALLDSIYL
jgi:hypothetical protein